MVPPVHLPFVVRLAARCTRSHACRAGQPADALIAWWWRRRLSDVGDDWRSLLLGAPPARA